jgi:methionyl aminopeptidase
MIKLKSKEEIEKLKISGQKLARVLSETSKEIAPGVTTDQLNDFAHKMIIEEGGEPAFLNYTPSGAHRPYPASLCVCINDEIVHGIPNEDPQTIQVWDVVTIDAGFSYDGMITDSAITVIVGENSVDSSNAPKEVRELLNRTREALNAAIKKCQVGNRIGDIGAVIEKAAKDSGLSVCEGLSGHGVGYDVHEDPYVPNEGESGTGPVLEEGMVIAIEPMFTLGTSKIKLDKDGYTYRTADGSLSAQFEHTVAITADGPIVLTKI